MISNLFDEGLESLIRNDGRRLKDGLIWDKEKQGYKFKRNNREVSEKYLYKVVAEEVDRFAQKQNKLATQFVNGNISFEEWQSRTVDLIRQSHVEMTRLGRGGKDNTFGIHYLEVGNDLRKTHYPAFRQFAEDVKNGKLTPRQIVARASLYGNASKTSFEKARISTKANQGVMGRRRLGACKNHCSDCIYYASLDWRPIELVIPPGINCQCRSNCCCSVEVKK